MEIENAGQVGQNSTALERARNFSQALSDAARRARFSTRYRRRLTGGGFQARRDAAILRFFVIASFAFMVAIPSLGGLVYYGLIASDQFVAEAKFTVSGGELPSADNIGSLTGIPAMAIIQDTQIVTNYIESRAALEKLEKMIDLRKLYSNPDADWWARFDPDKPIEKFLKYWKHMVDVSIKMPSGIVDFKVRAFTPQDAARIGHAVIEINEALINDMNLRMNHDAITNAEQQLERASQRLTRARLSYERARNDEGVLDASKAADSMNALVTETRGQLLKLQQQYNSQKSFVLESAPQMRALLSRIEATRAQIGELESKLTDTKKSLGAPTLAVTLTKFSELDLEQKIAERLYAGAAAALEVARLTAERKQMYIDTFVSPVAPETSEYPRRVLFPTLILIASLAVWGSCCGLVVLIRNHMA